MEDGVTGFVFDAYDAAAFAACALRAVRAYLDGTDTWRRMMRAAMSRDFGWERSEERYHEVYRRVLRDAVA